MSLSGDLEWRQSGDLAQINRFTFSHDGSFITYFDVSEVCYGSGTFADRGKWLQFNFTERDTSGFARRASETKSREWVP